MAYNENGPFIRRRNYRPPTPFYDTSQDAIPFSSPEPEDVPPNRVTTGAITSQPATTGRNGASLPKAASQALGAGAAAVASQISPNANAAAGIAGRYGPFGQTPPPSSVSTNGRPLTGAELARDIAQRNKSALNPQANGSNLPSGVQPFIGPDEAKVQGLQYTGGNVGYQPYLSPQQMTEQNLTYTGGPSSGSVNAPSQNTVHFLPPGFTATTGSTGVPGSTPNDIHFLPPGFTSVQGTVNPVTKQLQQPNDEDRYGSAYGY